MTSRDPFDEYARVYDDTVQAAIGASGESVAYFAELKARLTRDVAPTAATRVLDFGCGIGNATRALAATFPGSRIVGCDASHESLDAARAKSPGEISFVPTTGTKLPFDDAAFDVAVAACVFHHIERSDQLAWLRELARVLRPGGRLVMFEHNPFNPLTRRVVRDVPFDAGVELLTKSKSEALIRGSGLRVAASRYYFFFPHVLAGLRGLEPLMGWIPLGGQYFVVGER